MNKGFLSRLFLFFTFTLSAIFSTGVTNSAAGDVGKGKTKITKQWQTESIFRLPESVLYDEARDFLYISNIDGKPTEKNGLRFISKMSINGKIEKLKWATGLNAPKGSAINLTKL